MREPWVGSFLSIDLKEGGILFKGFNAKKNQALKKAGFFSLNVRGHDRGFRKIHRY
jgi:hypothetical protein